METIYFSPFHAAVASLAVTCSGITDADHLAFQKNSNKSKEDTLLEMLRVTPTAYNQLEVRAAISIFYNGLTDYSEAENDTYIELESYSEWGAGEEGTAVLDAQLISNEPKPSCLGFFQKDIMYLLKASENPEWHDVPYIKLIAENGEFPA